MSGKHAPQPALSGTEPPADLTSRAVHVAEFAWLTAWLALGALTLAALNMTFTTAKGDVTAWQLIFGFLSR